MCDDDEAMGRIVRLVQEGAKPEKSKQSKGERLSISVKGDGNTISTGNVVNINPVIKHTVKPDPTGTLTPAQKSDLQHLLYDWVDLHNEVKQKPLTQKAAWSMLNRHCRVNSYHQIRSEDFSKAVKFLRTQKGKILSMKSAPRKSPEFRKKAYATIFARGAELGDRHMYLPYIEKNFGTSSLKELSDKDLQKTRLWILRKR